MPILNLKILEGKGYEDIAPAAGCCGTQKPSMPLCFFCLDTAAMTWMTEAAPLSGSSVRWGKQFDTIKIQEHESARLHFVVVDGAHWKPHSSRQAVDMSRIPMKNFYGEYLFSVSTFEMMKRETHKIVLKARKQDGSPSPYGSCGDTGYSLMIEAYYEDGNIDDHRIGVNQGGFVDGPAVAPPAAPPQQGYQGYPPQQQGYPPQQQGYDQGYPPAQQYPQGYQTQPYPANDPAV